MGVDTCTCTTVVFATTIGEADLALDDAPVNVSGDGQIAVPRPNLLLHARHIDVLFGLGVLALSCTPSLGPSHRHYSPTSLSNIFPTTPTASPLK